MAIEAEALLALSEKASQGEWSLGKTEGGYRYLDAAGIPSKPGPDRNVKWSGFARFVVEMEDDATCSGRSNIEFVAALVNAYRDGSLIHRSALAEDTARAAEGIKATFAKVLLIQARELKRLAPDGETPADLDAAMADLRAALPLNKTAHAEGWEPIETAPRDGTWILGWQAESYSYGGKPANVVRWYYGMWTAWAESDSKDPTHWRPLPAPPALPLDKEAADANR